MKFVFIDSAYFSRAFLSSFRQCKRNMSRGALIVLEGCDHTGKTTQCKKLVDSLTKQNVKAKMWRFPDRTTAIGKVIDNYLGQKTDLEDHAIHLLFTANRWEAVPQMMRYLEEGTTLVVDRYSFSGVAFSAAKKGMDITYCKKPEIGLPKPDVVLYLTLSSEEAAMRGSFGEERYEKKEFQERVAENYQLLKDETYWKEVNANQSVENLHNEILSIVKNVRNECQNKKVGKLWTEEDNKDC